MRTHVFLILFSFSALAPVFAERSGLPNLEALSGYDPVSYFEGMPQEGKAGLSHDHAGVVYRFASESNRDLFMSNPDAYTPAYGGWCAYAMLEGDKVEVDPLSYKLVGGRLFLFYNGFWGDTLKKWNRKIAKAPEASLVDQADAEWRKLVGK